MPENTSENRVVYVKDKEGEVGIKVNNILTALILMVISWVGYSINELKDNVYTLTTGQAVNATTLQSIERRVEILERYHVRADRN